MALTVIASIRPAYSEPTDVFNMAAPAIGSSVPRSASIADGDSGVSAQTGAMTYQFPIAVPPGRFIQPTLALSYSSQAAIYGTAIASGWSLSGLPMISEDTSKGRLLEGKRYESSLAGGRPLIEVNEPGSTGSIRYRAQADGTFARYERFEAGAFWWKVMTPDGTTHYFGHKDAHTASCRHVSDGYAPITRSEDSFGNAIDYIWQGVDDECRIKAVTWGQNSNAQLGYFAAIEMDYEPSPPTCFGVPVGSQASYRTGVKIVTGASQLRAIEVAAFAPVATTSVTQTPIPRAAVLHTRTTTLAYSATTSRCDRNHGPYRALTSITAHAEGVGLPGVTLPPTTFEYGNAELPWAHAAVVDKPLPWLSTGGTSNSAHNLGWGYRFSGSTEWPTVEAMMIDIDGDGRLDRLSNQPYGQMQLCGARWERNIGVNDAGNIQFEDGGYIELPTLKWATVDGNADPYAGGAHARENRGRGADERCALNYQRTGYINSSDGGASTSLACMPGLTQCPASGVCANGDDCTGKNAPSQDTMFAWRWFDIDGDRRPDLIGSPIRGGLVSYNLRQGTGAPGDTDGGPLESAILWGRVDLNNPDVDAVTGFPSCPAIPHTAKPNDPNSPYTRCGGMFPWFVYRNHGNGKFGRVRPKFLDLPDHTHVTWGPIPDEIIYQPIPLESSAGDSSMLSMPLGQSEGVTDIDGDGYADAVYGGYGHGWTQWQVYRNNGRGHLLPSSTGSPYAFITGEDASLHVTGFEPNSPYPVSIEGLIDIHGDGLDDHWKLTCPEGAPMTSCQATTAIHAGTRFGLVNGFVQTPRLGTDAQTFGLSVRGEFANQSRRIDTRRMLDVDFDGRVDIVRFADGTTLPIAQLNVGGAFGDPAGTLGYGPSLVRQIVASDTIAGSFGEPAYTWEIRSDMLDLDGDGLADGIDFNDTYFNQGHMQIRRIETPTAPPRLLVSIDNHRGAVTTVRYSPMHEPTVTQTTNHKSPASQWVVQSTTTTESFSSTSATTSYRYSGPEFNADDRGLWGFRGFNSVEITSASGSRVDEHYSYAPDWSGRLVTRILHAGGTVPREDTGPRTIDETTWAAFPILGSIVTYHPTVADHWTCKNGQTASECRANTDTRTRILTTYEKLSAELDQDRPLLWQPVSSRLQASVTANVDPDAPDRTAITSFALYSTATAYRLRETGTQSLEHATTGDRVYARTATNWDDEFLVPLESEVWFDALDASRAVERRVFDMDTGQVVQRFKPEQNARGATSARFGYDASKRFVATLTNELGHETFFEYEPGTGTQLATIGPNRAACVTEMISVCPPGTREREEKRIRVDGLGRTIERFATFSDDGQVYVPRKIEIVKYDDHVDDGDPRSVTRWSAIDLDASNDIRYAESETTVDGFGRPTIERIATAGPVDHITVYAYRNDGTLSEVKVPDPSADDGSSVAYIYNFDSVGRPTEVIRPDADDVKDRSRIRMSYDGLTRTTREVVGAAGGLPASTTSVDDRFGRLVRVDEELGPMSWASTSYAYGPDDLVRTIIDPEGVTTYLRHDLGGRRTEIERAGRIWRYGYDRNGNAVSQIVPGAASALDETAFRTTTAYDDLDRPRSKLIGQRALSSDDQALFATGTETFTWDEGPGQIGQLRYWKTFAPGASAPAITIDTKSNAQGQPTQTVEALSIASYTSLTRRLSRDYHLSGAPRSTLYHDELDGISSTSSRVTLDARGLPSAVVLSMTGQHDQTLAVQTRNVAGLVTRRRTDVATAMEYVESSWSYDRLGRVASQVVQKGPQLATTQVVRQDLAYFGNDDPKTMEHSLGPTNSKRFAFTYDQRHQLVDVAEAAGVFSATYDYRPSGRLESAVETALALPGSNVKPRNVTYQYAGTDPEDVTALVKADGSMFASYEHDAAGNRTYQCEGEIRGATSGRAGSRAPAVCAGQSLDFVYDGKDQLRRVTRKVNGAIQGSEEYWYDGSKQRVATVKRDKARNKTRLIWWLDDTEAHYDDNGDIVRVHSHLSLGTPVARVTRESGTSTSVELQFHGLANNTLAAVDQTTGTINASFTYAPFGEIIEATDAGAPTNGTAQHRRRMNDKFVDEVSELAYYGFRYYDRTSLTWTQNDPLYRFTPDLAQTSPRRAQVFTFSLNNPLRYLDPDGLATTDQTGTGGGGGGTYGAPEGACGPFSQRTDCLHESVYGRGETPYGRSAPAPAFGGVISIEPPEVQGFHDVIDWKTTIETGTWSWQRGNAVETAGQIVAAVVGGGGLVRAAGLGASSLLARWIAPAAGGGASLRLGDVNANRLHHIFNQARHRLDDLVAAFSGSREATFQAIGNATVKAVESQGITGVFELRVYVGASIVNVRGNVIDGVVHVGTAFVK